MKKNGMLALGFVGMASLVSVGTGFAAADDRSFEVGKSELRVATRKSDLEYLEGHVTRENVSYVWPDGRTMLHLSSQPEITQLLLDRGAELGKQNSSGKTPLEYAMQNSRSQRENFREYVLFLYRNHEALNGLSDGVLNSLFKILKSTEQMSIAVLAKMLGLIVDFTRLRDEVATTLLLFFCYHNEFAINDEVY